MAVQCVLVGKGKDDVFIAVYGETTFDKVLKAYNENKVVQVIYQNRIYYLDNTTVVDSPEAFSFISAFSNQNDETGEIKHYVISLMTGDSWSGPFLQKSTPATHARTHAKNGTDPLAPADIGAMELSENILKQSNEDITSQVAQALSGDLVPFSGGTMTGLLNVLTPVGDSNATTKKYVDDALSEKIGMDGIGDLHVWKKTVVISQEIPAGYTLGDAESGMAFSIPNVGSQNYVTLQYGPSITVNDGGGVSLTSVTSSVQFKKDSNVSDIYDIRNNFVKAIPNSDSISAFDGVIFVPNDCSFRNTGGIVTFGKFYRVNAYPLTPARTTVTYPISTNRNAYQEGNGAKPAGYTLGEVESGKFAITSKSSPGGVGTYWNDSASLSVSDDGTCTLATTGGTYIDGTTTNAATTAKNELQGKFAYCTDTDTDFVSSVIVFFPSDTVFTKVGNIVYADRYQPVTGYAAIPANTTIEYLGCLGDKAGVQVLSYVGTGTYGSSNPNSLTFDFVPKAVFVVGTQYSDGDGISIMPMIYGYGFSNRELNDSNANYCIVTWNKKNVTWYAYSSNAVFQSNSQGGKYFAVAIG